MLRGESPVHHQGRAAHVAAHRGHHEEDRVGDLLDRCRAADGGVLEDGVHGARFDTGADHGSVDPAGVG